MAKVEFSHERVQKTHTIAFQCAREKKTTNSSWSMFLCAICEHSEYVWEILGALVRACTIFKRAGKRIPWWNRISKNGMWDNVWMNGDFLGRKLTDFTSHSISMALPANDVFILDAQDFFRFALAFFCWWNTDVGFSLHVPLWMWLFTSSFCM
jgi:hypothetical protein